jgi:hypothetical protein
MATMVLKPTPALAAKSAWVKPKVRRVKVTRWAKLDKTSSASKGSRLRLDDFFIKQF